MGLCVVNLKVLNSLRIRLNAFPLWWRKFNEQKWWKFQQTPFLSEEKSLICNEMLQEYPVGWANSSVTSAEVPKKKYFIFTVSLGRWRTWFLPFISTDHQLYMQLDVLAYLYLILSKICGSFTVVYNDFKIDTKSQRSLCVLKHFSCFLW